MALRFKWVWCGCALLLAACNSRVEKGDARIQNEGPVSFAQIQSTILKPSCVACHGGSQAPLLTSYEQVKANIAAIEKVVCDVKSMPKRGPLPESEISLLRRWITSGAPELAESAPPPVAERPPVLWKEVQKTVMVPKCVACHFKGNPEQISDLEDDQTVHSLVGSILFLTVANSTMPPPPKATPEGAPNPNQLSRVEKDVLAHWVVDGMRKE